MKHKAHLIICLFLVIVATNEFTRCYLPALNSYEHLYGCPWSE